MTVLIDPPNAPGHGRLWSHLASDESYAELHAFAARVGIPARGFDRDHYDVPADLHDRMLAEGALPVSSRELINRLVDAGLRRRKSSALGSRWPGQRLRRPALLRPGDLVAVVAPAGPTDQARLAAGIEVLAGWGLRVRHPDSPSGESLPWLAGSDEERATRWQDAWLDREVKAIWASRGGFGSQRLLDHVDWSALAQTRPTWLVGFSDVTALHQAVAARLGVLTAHGPGVAALAEADPRTTESVRALVMEGRSEPLQGRPGVGGVAEGALVGGNLATLASTVGTADSLPAAGGIALLEDVAEAPYRLDRLLTQLVRSGWLDDVRAIAVGDFTDCGDPDLVRRLLLERLGGLGVPLVLDLPVGHGRVNLTVPLGARARLDGAAGLLTPLL